MGGHRKKPGVELISLIAELARVLGYHVVLEERMFLGTASSPQLDVTWRRDKNARFPLFIFEVESSATKAASDNVMKVFSRETPSYQKPLFFFHIFLDESIGSERVAYLRENYDKVNYGAYSLSDEAAPFQLLCDIIDQHVRIESKINLYGLMDLIERQGLLSVTSPQILDRLVSSGYDQMRGSDFVLILESLIANENYPLIREFYLSYLPYYLSIDERPAQSYPYLLGIGYSEIIHRALGLILIDGTDFDEAFDALVRLERGFRPWHLWEPYFGLSYDHDMMLLSEFPLLLTLLCAAFFGSTHGRYFSSRLRTILEAVDGYNHYRIHGLIWLLIASRIAEDEEGYEFARSIINANDGISKEMIVRPTLFVAEEPDDRFDMLGQPDKVPPFQAWRSWLGGDDFEDDVDILVGLIEGFLVMNRYEQGRAQFADYCLRLSLG